MLIMLVGLFSPVTEYLDHYPISFGIYFAGSDYLDLSMNQIHGILPNLSATRLSDVNLSSNLFSGSLPLFPPTINMLDLSHNKFSELLSSSFCATSNLVYLDISDNLLSRELLNCWMQFHICIH